MKVCEIKNLLVLRICRLVWNVNRSSQIGWFKTCNLRKSVMYCFRKWMIVMGNFLFLSGYHNRGCQSWTIFISFIEFSVLQIYTIFAKQIWLVKSQKNPNITVTANICFFEYPLSKYMFFCFSTQNARRKWIVAVN